MCEGKKHIHVFGGKIEEKRILVKSRRTRNDDIKIQFKETDLTTYIGLIWLRTDISGGHL